MNTIDPRTKKKVVSSSGRLFGWNTIKGFDASPYMTRIWFGRLRLHIFHRGDDDPDPHDHPWNFSTLPLTPYVEEVTEVIGYGASGEPIYLTRRQIVPALRWSSRSSTHTHRVLGRWRGWWRRGSLVYPSGAFTQPLPNEVPEHSSGKIVTIVWRGSEDRPWGFLKNRDGKWCWEPWRSYILGGGKDSPCQ